MKTPKSKSKRQVRFSDRSLICVVNNLSLSREQASQIWYSQEETDLFEMRFSHQVREIRSQLRHYSALLDEGGITINAAAILGLEKHLSPELKVEHKERRAALRTAVLAEHRQHRVMHILPHSTARLAMVSAQHSLWARERAHAAAVFLEQDVLQDFAEMNLQLKKPRCCSRPPPPHDL